MDSRVNNILEFLAELQQNNNREWFNAHKTCYLAVKSQFEQCAEQLIGRLCDCDKSLGALTLADCTYRIYRDIRFSPDKLPYKTHMGVYVCPGGKKSGYSGYYFHFEPYSQQTGCLMAVGMDCPESKIIRSIREEIIDNTDAVRGAIARAEGWRLSTDYGVLTRLPKGFEQYAECGDLLRLKNFMLEQHLDAALFSSDDWIDRVVERFTRCREFNDIVNRAVRYAFEEM